MKWSFLVVVLFLQAGASSRGSIDGVVMKAGTALQQPLSNARLELREGPGTPRVVRSDAAGKFIFPNLAPGRYRLFLTQDGFIRKEHGQSVPNMPGAPIIVAPGQQVTNIIFRLDAAPTIAGWVLDQEGNPLANIVVSAARRTYDVRGRATLTVAASAVTDDRGAYRIFWVDPGDYYVSAGYTPLLRSGNADEPPARATYAPVYFPGVTDPEGVQPIRVDIGREINGVDFRLRRQSLAAITGQAMNAITRRPVAATITLTAVDGANEARYRGQSSAASGAFVFAGVPPGSYIVAGKSAFGENLAGFTRIRVPSVQGFFLDVRLLLSPGMRVNGRMTSGSDSLPDIRGSQITLMALEPGVPSPAGISPLPDGQFSITDVVPGEYLLMVSDLPDDIYVKAVRQGNTYLSDTAITLGGGSGVQIEIVLGSDGGRISAAIFDRENRPVSAAQAVLVPDATRRHRPDQYRIGTSGEAGGVTMRGVPPGDYKLFAWEGIEPNAYLNPDYLRVWDSLGLHLRVVPGQNGPVQARLIPADR